MKAWLKKLGFGLKIAEAVMVKAGEAGIDIHGVNPAQLDGAIRSGAKGVVDALKKKPSLVPPSTTGE